MLPSINPTINTQQGLISNQRDVTGISGDDLTMLHEKVTALRATTNGILETSASFRANSDNTATELYKLNEESLIYKLDEAEDRQFEKPTIKSLDVLPSYYKHTYTVLDKIFNDDASVKIGSLGGRNIVWKNTEGEQINEMSLRSVAKKINHIIAKTSAPQDREILSRVANKINAMWQESEELIKDRNICMRILFHIGKIFSWKVLVIPPEQEIQKPCSLKQAQGDLYQQL